LPIDEVRETRPPDRFGPPKGFDASPKRLPKRCRGPAGREQALEQARRQGSARIAEAINLIVKADLDVRGASGLDSMVVEIVVARLAFQTRPPRQTRSRTTTAPTVVDDRQ
jgi:hypothetical protein